MHRTAGDKTGKKKLIETDRKREEREKRGCFTMSEAALCWNLFICLVDRKSLTGKHSAQ